MLHLSLPINVTNSRTTELHCRTITQTTEELHFSQVSRINRLFMYVQSSITSQMKNKMWLPWIIQDFRRSPSHTSCWQYGVIHMRQRYSFILVADCIHQNLTFKIQQSFPYVLLILLLSFSSANYIIFLFKTFFLKYYHSFLCVTIIKTKWKS